jgi:hypothetical protein
MTWSHSGWQEANLLLLNICGGVGRGGSAADPGLVGVVGCQSALPITLAGASPGKGGTSLTDNTLRAGRTTGISTSFSPENVGVRLGVADVVDVVTLDFLVF